jgi:hypothetical protein
VLLSAQDMRPLREQAQHAQTMMQVLQSALLAQHHTEVRHQYLSDHGAGDVSGLNLSVTAQDGQRSGLRIFGNPPHNRTYMLLDQHTRSVLAVMDYGVLNSLRAFAVEAAARDSARQCLTNPSREAFATDATARASLRLSRLCLPSTSKVDVSMAIAMVASPPLHKLRDEVQNGVR